MIAAPSAAADITSTAREKPCCARTWPADVMTSTSRAPASFTNLTSGSSVHVRSEEHTSELQSQSNLVCRLLLEKKKKLQYLSLGKIGPIILRPEKQPMLSLCTFLPALLQILALSRTRAYMTIPDDMTSRIIIHL